MSKTMTADKFRRIHLLSCCKRMNGDDVSVYIDKLIKRVNSAQIYPNDIHIKIDNLCFNVKFREENSQGPHRYVVLCCQDKPLCGGPWEHYSVAILSASLAT
ncbi:MAG: hypothetical protein MN733_14705 [Nitrososphaera sp.]|nr:hypothetical protein [Nitrososphaera sp.]